MPGTMVYTRHRRRGLSVEAAHRQAVESDARDEVMFSSLREDDAFGGSDGTCLAGGHLVHLVFYSRERAQYSIAREAESGTRSQALRC